MPPAQGGVDGGSTGEGDKHAERSFVSAPVPSSDADARVSVVALTGRGSSKCRRSSPLVVPPPSSVAVGPPVSRHRRPTSSPPATWHLAFATVFCLLLVLMLVDEGIGLQGPLQGDLIRSGAFGQALIRINNAMRKKAQLVMEVHHFVTGKRIIRDPLGNYVGYLALLQVSKRDL
ncbi:hypothetical protein E2562_032042 [Oryza meyeriana var. granulata]|uniref:Uncharacterized protein n=1 Tax=Oryza meyeriana var. granulata TaxID=110450 RepID=A0A6G1FEL8_9ORYZ|nr:hypothetical protein E2562_032042 [Oryza meyeriana var. granulata]